jgi:hypothetical protein
MTNLAESGFVGFMDFRNGRLQTRWCGLAVSAFSPYCLAWAASLRQRRNGLPYPFFRYTSTLIRKSFSI